MPGKIKSIFGSVWLWLAVTFIVSFLFAYFATYVVVDSAEFPPIGGDVKNIIQIIQKYDDPTLFSRDFVFADNTYKLYGPVYINLVRFIHRITGALNYEISIQYLMFPICFIFVFSMTWLLWKVTRMRWVSLLLALFATLSIEVIYGNLTYSAGLYVTPRFLFLGLTPLLFGLLLFYGRSRLWGPLIFLAAGLASNLHSSSGIGLIFAFGISWVIYDMLEKPSWRKLGHWALCGLAAILGALPFLMAFQSGQTAGGGEAASVSPEAFNTMLNTRLQFYPMGIYNVQLQWPAALMIPIKIFFYIFPLFVIASLWLRYSGKKKLAYFLLYFVNLVFMILVVADESWKIIIAVVLPLLILGIYDLLKLREIDFLRLMLVYLAAGFAIIGVIFSLCVVDIAQVLKLYMPWFYFDFGVATKYLAFLLNIYGAILLVEVIKDFRLVSKLRAVLRSKQLAILVIILVILVSGLLYHFYKAPYNGFTYYIDNARGVILRQQIFTPSPVQLDYREATTWIKNNTDKDTLFLVLNKEPAHDFMFRYKTQRSMWACSKDGGFSFYAGHNRFVRWYEEFKAEQDSLVKQNPADVTSYASTRGINYLFIDKQNYNWLSESGLPVVFENKSYLVAVVQSGG